MYQKETWHGFHFIMCLLTGLVWTPIWIWRTLSNNQHNRKVEMQIMRESLEEMKRNRSN